MKFFSIDSPIYKFMSTLTGMVLLNLCWIIGCIPIVTAGVSTVAAYDVGLRMVSNEEGYIVKQYLKAFKANLKQGIPLGLITAVCAYAVYLDFEIFSKVPNASIFLLMIGMLSAAIFYCSLLYAYPLTARYENKLMMMLKNSFRISTRYFVRTLLLTLLLALELGAFLWNYTTLFLGALIGPVSLILTVSMFARGIFEKLEKEEDEGE